MNPRQILSTALLITLFIPFSQHAHSQLSHNLSIGNPVALSMGNSAIAQPLGVDSIHFNPANLALIENEYKQYKVQLATLKHSGNISGSGDGETFDQFDNPAYLQDPLLKGQTSQPIEVKSPSVFLPFFDHVTLPVVFAPGYGTAKRSEDKRFVFANAAFAIQAFGYERDKDNAAAFNGQQFGITRLAYFNPSIGFELFDDVYFGASIGFSWQGLGVTSRTRSSLNGISQIDKIISEYPDLGLSLNPYNDVGTLEIRVSDPLSITYTVGVLWQPEPWLSIGATYQSPGKSNMKGEFNIRYTDSFQSLMTTLQPAEGLLRLLDGGDISADARQSGKVEVDYTQPQWAGIGVSLLVTPQLRINTDIKWVDYRSVEEFRFEFDQDLDYLTLASVVNSYYQTGVGGNYADANVLALQRRYQAVVDWSIGMEYKYNNSLKLRAGYEPRSSSIPEDRQDLLIPIGEADLYTLGFGYSLGEGAAFDVGFGYLVTKLDIEPGESRNSTSTIEGDVVYNPYRGLQIDHKLEVFILSMTYSKQF